MFFHVYLRLGKFVCIYLESSSASFSIFSSCDWPVCAQPAGRCRFLRTSFFFCSLSFLRGDSIDLCSRWLFTYFLFSLVVALKSQNTFANWTKMWACVDSVSKFLSQNALLLSLSYLPNMFVYSRTHSHIEFLHIVH